MRGPPAAQDRGRGAWRSSQSRASAIRGEPKRALRRPCGTGPKPPAGITCDAALWAARIGGAMQQDDYKTAIEAAGLEIDTIQENTQYEFISDQAQGATKKYGVRSVSILARKG